MSKRAKESLNLQNQFSASYHKQNKDIDQTPIKDPELLQLSSKMAAELQMSGKISNLSRIGQPRLRIITMNKQTKKQTMSAAQGGCPSISNKSVNLTNMNNSLIFGSKIRTLDNDNMQRAVNVNQTNIRNPYFKSISSISNNTPNIDSKNTSTSYKMTQRSDFKYRNQEAQAKDRSITPVLMERSALAVIAKSKVLQNHKNANSNDGGTAHQLTLQSISSSQLKNDQAYISDHSDLSSDFHDLNGDPEVANATIDNLRNKSKRKSTKKSKLSIQKGQKNKLNKEKIIDHKAQNFYLLSQAIDQSKKISKNLTVKKQESTQALTDQLQFTCGCPKLVGVNYACLPIYKILISIYGEQNGEINYESMCKQYWDIEMTGAQCQELKAFDTDIEKDLLRTFPQVPQFQFHNMFSQQESNAARGESSNANGNRVAIVPTGIHVGHIPFQFNQNPNYYRLKRVLSAFSYYDHTIGYMQGMNFIVASLMYHCNEEVAFWLFVHLLQMNEVRTIYQPPNMPGLILHVRVLELLIARKLSALNDHLIKGLGLVTHQIYLHDWIICLYTSIMPIDLSIDFLSGFFQKGWVYFYKVALAILMSLEHRLLAEKELDRTLAILKFRQPSTRNIGALNSKSKKQLEKSDDNQLEKSRKRSKSKDKKGGTRDDKVPSAKKNEQIREIKSEETKAIEVESVQSKGDGVRQTSKYLLRKRELMGLSMVAQGQLDEIPEVKVQDKVYDGRQSKYLGVRDSKLNKKDSDADNQSASDSDLDNCQFDFDEQSIKQSKVIKSEVTQKEGSQKNKAGVSQPTIRHDKIIKPPMKSLRPVSLIDISDGYCDKSNSLSEIVERNQQTKSIVQSYSSKNQDNNNDLKKDLDSQQIAKRFTVGKKNSRETESLVPEAKQSSQDQPLEDDIKSSVVSDISDLKVTSKFSSVEQDHHAETSPQRTFKPFTFFKGLFQEKIHKKSLKQPAKPIDYAQVWEQVFESVDFIEIEEDVAEITAQVQQHMCQTNLNGSIMASQN